MEPNYIKTRDAQEKGIIAAEKLEMSPTDKHKAQYGDTN